MTLKRKGNKLYSDTHQFLISQRKKVTPQKTKFFLLQVTPVGRKYISSLYGAYPDYQIEYQGKRYHLILSETSAELNEMEVSNV